MKTRTGRTTGATLMVVFLLNCVFPPCGSCTNVLNPRGAAAARAAGRVGPIVTSGVPSEERLAQVRARVGPHTARLWLGPKAYDVRGARFDSSGVRFAGVPADGEPRRGEPPGAMERTPIEPLAAPIGWDRIDRIEVRKTCGLRGTLVGGLAGIVVMFAAADQATRDGGEVGPGILILAVCPPAGALVGGVVGAAVRRTEPVWQHADRARGAEVATSGVPLVLSSTPSAAELALLRSAVGRRTVRVSVGREDYETRDARFDSTGVGCSGGVLERLPLGAGDDPRPLAAPVAWDRIERIRACHSHARLGALAGAMLAVVAVVNAANDSAGDPGEVLASEVVVTPFAAAGGALLGALVGRMLSTWPVVMQRAPAAPRTR